MPAFPSRWWKGPVTVRRLLRFVHCLPSYDSPEHLGGKQLFGRDCSYIPVEDNEICKHPRHDLALLFLVEFGEGRTHGVSRDGLIHGEPLLGEIFLLAVLTLAHDGGIESA